jgi:RNA polymerase sigma-70 factor (ECF subfamily)
MTMKKRIPADEQLVHSLQTTPTHHCFETLYQRYIGKVYRKCLSFTNDAQAAQDYTQDIFLKVYTKLDSFERQSSFSTWLYAIAHNYCLDQHRLAKRLPTEPLSADLVANFAAYSYETDPCRLLERVLDELPPADRRLLQLRYEQGLSVVALGAHYGLSESAVKMRLKRSRDRLRRLYNNQADATR